MSATISPYPHWEIEVRDNSIYNPTVVEQLPVHRPIWLLKTQYGEVGKPIWCSGIAAFRKYFGGETVNENNKLWLSRQAYFLSKTLQNNGAFVMRVLADNATKANTIVEAWVELDGQVPQYEYDENGNIVVETDPATGEQHYVPIYEEEPTTYLTVDDLVGLGYDSTTAGTQYLVDLDGNLLQVVTTETTGPDGKPVFNPSIHKQLTKPGMIVTFRRRQPTITVDGTPEKLDGLTPQYYTDPGDGTEGSKKTYLIVPLFAIEAAYLGAYANSYAFSLGWAANDNRVTKVDRLGSQTYKIGFSTLNTYGEVQSITNTSKETSTAFTANPEAIDPVIVKNLTAAQIPQFYSGLSTVLDKNFDGDTAILPFAVTTYEENQKLLGNLIAYYALADEGNVIELNELGRANLQITLDEEVTDSWRTLIKTCLDAVKGQTFLYTAGMAYGDEAGALLEALYLPTTGFKLNFMTGQNSASSPYLNVLVDNTTVSPIASDALGLENVVMSLDYHIYARGGSEGNRIGTDTYLDQDQLCITRMRHFLTGRYPADGSIVDKFRYPITHIYDYGVDLETKLAMIDFLDIRDDVAVSLTPQSFYDRKTTKEELNEIDPVTGKKKIRTLIGTYPEDINDRDRDEYYGNVLRQYALLKKESVINNTDCCRCVIYPHVGVLADAQWKGYMPFTLWDAVQHSIYGNTPAISKDEPTGQPNSFNDLFKISTINWLNYDPEIRSRCWENGLNYCMYGDTSRIFYPALRTVYLAETSVLVNQYFMDAVVYTKHEIRKTWAKYVGTRKPNAVLQADLSADLTNRLKDLYNDLYTFSVSVYQTQEDKNLGYVQHCRVSITSPATFRVLVVDIEVNREDFTNEAEG